MDVKPRPNHALYIQTLRKMTSEQRLLKAFELSQFSKDLFLHGLRRRFPDKSEKEIKRLYLEHLLLSDVGYNKRSLQFIRNM